MLAARLFITCISQYSLFLSLWLKWLISGVHKRVASLPFCVPERQLQYWLHFAIITILRRVAGKAVILFPTTRCNINSDLLCHNMQKKPYQEANGCTTNVKLRQADLSRVGRFLAWRPSRSVFQLCHNGAALGWGAAVWVTDRAKHLEADCRETRRSDTFEGRNWNNYN
jgi:hypothetical protein